MVKKQISLPVKDDYHHQDPAIFHPLPKHDRQKGGMDSPQCSFFRDEIFFYVKIQQIQNHVSQSMESGCYWMQIPQNST